MKRSTKSPNTARRCGVDFESMRAVPRGFGNSRAASELIVALERAFADTTRVADTHRARAGFAFGAWANG